jgi:hypothetical protein
MVRPFRAAICLAPRLLDKSSFGKKFTRWVQEQTAPRYDLTKVAPIFKLLVSDK